MQGCQVETTMEEPVAPAHHLQARIEAREYLIRSRIICNLPY